MKKIDKAFPVMGMHCAVCARTVEETVAKMNGVHKSSVLFAEKLLLVQIDPQVTSPQEIAAAVQSVGFEVLVTDSEAEAQELNNRRQQQYRRLLLRDLIGSWVATLLSMLFMWSSILPHSWRHPVLLLLAASVFFLFALRYHKAAIMQLKHRILSMDTLVSLSTTISFIAGFCSVCGWWETSEAHIYLDATIMIPAFILLGKWMEERATLRTGSAVAALVNSRPKRALLVTEGETGTVEVEVEAIREGHTVRVRAGEAIPVDGVVTEGCSVVQEQMISGEPIPVEKSPGSSLYAGTINGSGILTMRTTHIGRETVLGSIIEAVRNAETQKPPIRLMADRLAAIFVPVVVGLSLLTLLVWGLLGVLGYVEDAWSIGIRSAVSVLVISCPCALGLATPTALTVAVGEAARAGIFIRKPAAMELLPRIRKIFMDKTGTITQGLPTVEEAEWFVASEEIPFYAKILYQVERYSTHPLAEAMCRYLKEYATETFEIKDTQTVPGKGMEAFVEGQRIRVGSASFTGVAGTDENDSTQVYMSADERPIVRCRLQDSINPKSGEAIAQLKRMSMKTTLLTGDNLLSARRVAASVGIEEVYAQLLPDEKRALITEAQKQDAPVAMVGDGINDSTALAQADVSVAMATGSDIAVSVADLTLARQDLTLLPQAISIMRLSMRTIRINFFWALVYNAIAIPIAAGLMFPWTGLLITPAISGAAMAMSSLSVVSNSLLLKLRLRRRIERDAFRPENA